MYDGALYNRWITDTIDYPTEFSPIGRNTDSHLYHVLPAKKVHIQVAYQALARAATARFERITTKIAIVVRAMMRLETAASVGSEST